MTSQNQMMRSKSINDLTIDDSKILGTNTIKKLEKISTRNHFNTQQFETICSNWTPVSNRTYNKSIFKERNELIFNWFDVWTDEQRNEFLTNLFLRFSPSQFVCIYDYFDKKVPLKRVDFTRILPKVLSLKIFSHLDPRSLSRSSQVSWHWKFLTEQDMLWIPKCKTFGWYLPYSPSESEFGAWKRHYISNAISVDMSVGQIRGSVWRRLALTDCSSPITEKKIPQSKKYDNGNEIIKSALTKPPWTTSSAFPMDIERGSKALFAGLNPNEQYSELNLNDTVTSVKSSPRNKIQQTILTPRDIKDKITLTNLINWEERRMIELVEENKNDSTVTGSDIVKCRHIDPLSWQAPNLNGVHQLQSIISGYSGWANPRVIFISSKVPAAEMLLDSVIFGVIPIPYDYDSTTVRTIIYDLKSVLRGRKALSIGLFGHRNKENEMWICRNKCISRKNNMNDPEIKEFIQDLAANVCPKEQNGHIDLFSPFGAFEAGVDMLNQINDLTKSNFQAPISVMEQYKFILGDWSNTTKKDIHPCFAYFAINKLNSWVEFSETINEICSETKLFLKNKYPDIEEIFLKKLTGSIIQEVLIPNPNLNVKEVRECLMKSLSKCVDGNPLLSLHKHLTQILQQNQQETNNPIEKSLKNEGVLSSTQRIEHKPKFSLRETIVKEFLLNEKKYLQILKSISECYYSPLKKALLSNRPILGPHNIQIIFGDILKFILPSESLIKSLELRLKQWSVDQCVGDILETYMNDLIIIFESFFISYPNSLTNLERCRETNLKFRNFLTLHENQPESGMLSLYELFLQPINRISEYMNIIHWLLSNTTPEHTDVEALRQTLTSLSKINKIIVQEKSRVSKGRTFKEIQDKIINCPLLIEPGRYFVTSENFTIFVSFSNSKSLDQDIRYFQPAKDCGIFLFNDSLIITRITRQIAPYFRSIPFVHSFEKALPLSRILLYDIPDRKDIQYAFQIHCGPRSWIFGCHSVEKKYHFTTILKEYIQLTKDNSYNTF